jgi:hypothetical protein
MPKKRRYDIRHRPARVVLSDVLPFEVPVHFSNVGFYRFLNDTEFAVRGGYACFKSDDPFVPVALRILIGKDAPLETEKTGKTTEYRIPLKTFERPTVPLQFRIRHRSDQFRQLTIPHPASQIALVAFYEKYRGLILHYTSRSEFSVRHPYRISRYTVVRDSVFRELKSLPNADVEVAGREYEQVRSYFVYRKYDNVQEFYESTDYRESEKRFGHLMRLDISKCFDSIYTHSIGWAIADKEAVKREFEQHSTTFAHAFDRAVRAINDNETNGIPIGPEISRLFAEVVLQRVDHNLSLALERHGLLHGRDYEILRYVDDYFIFMRSPEMKELIAKHLSLELRPFKLFLNEAKQEVVSTPFMSDMSIAKTRISKAMQKEVALDLALHESGAPDSVASFKSSAREMLSSYKTTLRETNLGPLELVNYTLSTLERRLEHAVEQYDRSFSSVEKIGDKVIKRRLHASNQDALTKLFAASIDFAFYVFGGSPRVGPAIKLARLVVLCREACTRFSFGTDNRNLIDDRIYSEVLVQMNRNPLDEDASVEGLYLLTLLGSLGDTYKIDPTILYRFAAIIGGPGGLTLPAWHNALTVSALLQFIRDDADYKPLKTAIEAWILERTLTFEKYGRPVAERAVLSLDALASPFVSLATKKAIAAAHMPKNSPLPVAEAHDRWFVNWSAGDLYGQLRNKRVQEVY